MGGGYGQAVGEPWYLHLYNQQPLVGKTVKTRAFPLVERVVVKLDEGKIACQYQAACGRK